VSETAAVFLTEGSLMPNYRGEPTAWMMISAKTAVPRPLYDHPPVGFPVDGF
jgi:hypothetical protein